jgi:hypothetical protein
VKRKEPSPQPHPPSTTDLDRHERRTPEQKSGEAGGVWLGDTEVARRVGNRNPKQTGPRGLAWGTLIVSSVRTLLLEQQFAREPVLL